MGSRRIVPISWRGSFTRRRDGRSLQGSSQRWAAGWGRGRGTGTGMSDLPARVGAHFSERGWISPGDAVVVACSGGLDSLVLLHLLRFCLPSLRLRTEVAHFDHRMRKSSSDDAAWLSGLARAWDVPLHMGRADEVPTSEAAARDVRYRFLEELRSRIGARWVVTAHHADDQVETVLFRLLRGTGIEGLRGIPEVREPGILRPLLPFTRSELEGHAARAHIQPREDPSNRSSRFARNRVRHGLLPHLERIHPGARGGVLRISRHAAEAAVLLDGLIQPMIDEVVLERADRSIRIDRDRFLRFSEIERAEILRRLCDSLSLALSESGTATTLQFMTRGSSGSEIRLSGSVRLARSFDRFVLERCDSSGQGEPPMDGSLTIPSLNQGKGEFTCSARRYEARWGVEGRGRGVAGESGWEWAIFPASEIALPLCFRTWRDGDRTRTPGGGKKLKKLFGELRVPREDRDRLPLLVDAEGVVIWIPGRHQAPGPVPLGGAEVGVGGSWFVGVRNVDGS
ncbi:MAG: tRNA lysidine(34) synthetase TilS [Gemmatimonadetes bacterium]|nr:tRNA lysidine(34) synthetase TilS [Gemmatimonadota bacterium]